VAPGLAGRVSAARVFEVAASKDSIALDNSADWAHPVAPLHPLIGLIHS
jgi:hypothetical protein